MTWLVGQTILWLFAAAVACGVTFIFLATATKIFRGRALELKASREALEEYERTIDLLLDDPATPESARDLLSEFDRGVMHKQAAYFVAKSIFRNHADWLKKDGHEPKVITEMRALGKHRPELYEAFTTAIASGFMATMLRWFIPARALSMLIVDPRRDPVSAAQAVACGVDSPHDGPLPQAA